MTISRNVYNQLFEQAPDTTEGASKEKVIRLRPTEAKAGAVVMSAKNKIQMWTKEEHERFLAALEKFPAGPWKKVADFIGTKTPRQTMTHAQKYRQKIHRRQRGLRNQKKATMNALPMNTSFATVDITADLTNEPKTIVSPYGVADFQLRAGSEAVAAAAAAAGVTNDQLLNILAQQATTIKKDINPDSRLIEEGVSMKSLELVPAMNQESSSNTNLPSLAKILHLGDAEGHVTMPAELYQKGLEMNTTDGELEFDQAAKAKLDNEIGHDGPKKDIDL